MKTGLINTYSTRNLGDAAIYAALAGLAPGGRVFAALQDDHPTLVPGLERTGRLGKMDIYISVGGDIFNNGRPGLVSRRFFSLIREARSDPARSISFGQSIPPSCRGFALSMLAATLRRFAAVTVRDEESFKLLRSRGVDANLSYDAAFMLRPSPKAIGAAHRLFQDQELDPNKTALISLRGGSELYGLGDNETDKMIAVLIRQLQNRGHRTALLLQSDCDHADGDRKQARRLSERLGDIPVIDPFTAEAPLPSFQLMMGALAIANLVAAVRYHAAVLRLAAGRQPYILHYSNKGQDLCQRLGLSGQCFADPLGDAAIADLEATSNSAFDPDPITRDVESRFNDGLHAARTVIRHSVAS